MFDTETELRVDEALHRAQLALRPSSSASLDAQLLLAHVLGTPRAWLFAHGNASLDNRHQAELASLIRRRQAGEPIAYLRGYVEWYGLELQVTREVLVPRPETELLVEKAIELGRERELWTFADIGTGSGAIALQLARAFPQAQLWAVDASEAALAVAHRNLRTHGVADRVRLLHGDLAEPLPEPPGLVVANLPYLSDDMMTSLDRDVRHEPSLALRGGASGLKAYRDMFAQISDRGWRPPMAIEIDPRQSKEVGALAARFFPDIRADIFPDYAGLDRIVVLDP